MTLNIISTIIIAKGYTIINTLTLSVPSRINDCAIGEGTPIYPDRGDAESNIEDDTLGHALPMISPYGHG